MRCSFNKENILLADTQIMKSWKEHFYSLLNSNEENENIWEDGIQDMEQVDDFPVSVGNLGNKKNLQRIAESQRYIMRQRLKI